MNKSYQPRSRKNIKLAVTSMIAAFALIWQMGASAVYAQTSEPTAEPSVTPEVQTTPEPTEDPGYEVGYNTQTGMVSYLGASVDSPIENPAAGDMTAQSQPESYEAYARGFLAVYGSQFGLADAENDLVLKSETQPDDRRVVLRFQQMYQEVPVMAGELVVQLDLSGNVISVNGEVLPNIDLATEATVSSEAAAMAGLQLVGGKYDMTSDQLMVTEPELWIYSPQLLGQDDANAYLVWRMDVVSDRDLAVDELVLIDAFAGLPILNFSQIDASKAVQIYDAAGSNTPKVSGTMICDQTTSGSCTGDYSKAYTIASNYYDMLHNYFNRDSLDNAGMALRVYLHSGSGAATYEDGLAFWDGDSVLYMNTKTVANDIVAHEFSHGMIEYTTGLFNYYQSGAISESLADLWGEMYDQIYDPTGTAWLIGEETGTYLRSMINPPAKSQPDKMTNSYYFTGTTDNGGVHTNSGVNNKAIYLMAVGGTFNGYTVIGIGLPKVAAIYYEAQENLLTSGSGYSDLFNYVNQACINLIGTTPYNATSAISSSDCTTVHNATLAVEMYGEPVTGYNADPIVCASGLPTGVWPPTDKADMEDGTFVTESWAMTGGWTFDGGIDYYGENAHSGVHFVQISTSSNNLNATLTTGSSTIPIGSYLYVFHDYDFELNKDGGVIEYSTNGGVSWTNASALIETSLPYNNGYDGSVTALGGNGFTGASHGYVGTRLDLNSLVGQSVIFRLRVATDSGGTNGRGWWVDDFRIYRCLPTIDSVTPTTKTTNEAGFTLTVNGANYFPDSVIRWNGSNRSTTYVSSTQLTATIPASDLTQISASNITVYNSAPGGGASNVIPFYVTSFADVPGTVWYWRWVEGFFNEGITTGCAQDPLLRFCPTTTVTRAQMAVFILRAMNGGSYTPPSQANNFADVPTVGQEWTTNWINQFYVDGITTGCGTNPALLYCPDREVTRAEMAVFLLRAEHGRSYTPPAATGVFADVPAVGQEWTQPWIEQFYREGITTGCGTNPFRYCPSLPVTRAEMAIFIGRMFNITQIP